MWDCYFTYWDDLPEGSGFPLFGTTHIVLLIAELVCVCIGTIIYKRLQGSGRSRMRKVIAIVMFVMELYKDSVLTATGHMEVQYLPLQLCGMAIIIESLYAFFSQTRAGIFLGEVMCIACMPGAAAALLFPDWTRYPLLNFMCLHSFIVHGFLVLMPSMVMAAGDFAPRIKHIYMVYGFLAAAALCVAPINTRYGCNFMFLVHPSNGSPFAYVYANYGYAAYLVVYACVAMALVLLMYGAVYAARRFFGEQKAYR